MRFSTVSLFIALGASTVNGFGVVPSPIKRGAAFTSPYVPTQNSRGALTKVEMGVVNPPPNETTGVKAVVRFCS